MNQVHNWGKIKWIIIMAYLNANIPVPIYAQIRKEYLYDLIKNIMAKLKTVLSLVLAVLQDGLYLWHAIMENGAVFYRLPITAFIQRGYEPESVPIQRLDELELWNSFSYYPAVTSWIF